jgi:hypothetical protein
VFPFDFGPRFNISYERKDRSGSGAKIFRLNGTKMPLDTAVSN